MGASHHDPLAEAQAPTLHSKDALYEMAELLELVHYWRTRCERVEMDRDMRIARWRKANKKK